MIAFRPSDDLVLMAELDRICFPIDTPADYPSAHWFLGRDTDGTIAAFCAWRPVPFGDRRAGFHYRVGVLAGWRGHGLQREMIRLRESEMRKAGLGLAVTYTDADGAASMRNLIAERYLPYAPTEATCLSGPLSRLGRVGFVHWRKELGGNRQ
jgi:GNAT superfamily N-acetyltransferase